MKPNTSNRRFECKSCQTSFKKKERLYRLGIHDTFCEYRRSNTKPEFEVVIRFNGTRSEYFSPADIAKMKIEKGIAY